MQNFAPLSKTRTRRAMNEQASAWMTAVEGLPAVAARLKRVVILNDDALAVIQREDGPKTLFYSDPPYLHETRTATNVYDHEMTASDHEKLLTLLNQIQGAVLISGYRSELYDSMLVAPQWERFEFDLPNNAASGSSKRRMVECVWRKAAVSR
jgi:DNA adenine methylase